MKKKPASCFISYCHKGIDRDTLNYVKFVLEDKLKDLILFLFDEDLPLGKSFDDFMALLDEVEVVLIFFTPS